MTAYRVYFTATANLAVKVEINDDGLDPAEARDVAIEAAYNEQPSGICAQCSGWGQPWSIDLGEFEADQGDEAVEKVQP